MANEHSRSKYISLILILGTLTALGPFSIDMYLPGFPAIGKELGVDPARVALSLSSFFVGISAGQLLYGPLLDRFGRKKPLYIGLILYVLSSIGCIYASSLNSLILLRFVQAIGSCAAAVASVAMVRDLFPVNENAKVFALLMLVVGTSPMIAPTVGSYVTSAFSWHAVFLVLGVIGALILLATIFWLPESYKPDTSMSLKPRPIINNFLQVISEPQFYTYCFAGAISFSGLFAYVSASPQVFMDIYQLSDKAYGWIFAFLSIGLIGSSQVNSILLKRFTSQQIVPVALAAQTITGLIFVVCAWNNWLSLAGIIVLLFAFLCCLGFINPNTAALSLAPFTKNAGSASSLMGAIQMGIGSLASTVVSLYNTHTATPMAVTMFGSSLVALMILIICSRNIKSAVTTGTVGAAMAH